jgi:divalent metal cation (Fe/Co/Zn/Cd) transporter
MNENRRRGHSKAEGLGPLWIGIALVAVAFLLVRLAIVNTFAWVHPYARYSLLLGAVGLGFIGLAVVQWFFRERGL